MAREAADVEVTGPEVGDELMKAFERIRQDAKALATRAGWNDDDSFEQEVPPLVPGRVPTTHRVAAPFGGPEAYQLVASGRRAKVRLGQLAAWAQGHQETFEIEARLKANAEAKLAAELEKAKLPPGFRAPD